MVQNATLNSLRDVAIQLGYTLYPIKANTKRPDAGSNYRQRIFTSQDLEGYTRIGLSQGDTQKLWTLDVDTKNHHDPKRLIELTQALVQTHFNPSEYVEKSTISGGLHFVFKSNQVIPSAKFAHSDKGVFLEGIGKGYYIVVYEEQQQRVLSELVTLKEVDVMRINKLIADCILSNEKPPAYNYDINHFQLFKEQVSWEEIFHPLGYELAREDSNWSYWRRPGTKEPYSGKVSKESDRYFNWSTSVDELPHATEGKGLDKVFVYCALNNLDAKRPPIKQLIEDLNISVPDNSQRKLSVKEVSKTNGLPSYIKTVGEFVKRGKELPPIKGYFGRWISNNAVSMFFAPTGIGKSLAMMYISELVTKGMTFEMDLPNENGPKSVFYIDMELREEDIYDRYPNYAPNSRFYRVQKPVEGDEIYDMYWDMSGHQQLKFWLESSEYIDDLGLVVVDNLSFFIPDESDVKVSKKLMALLTNHAKSKRCAVVVINHKTKAVSQTGRLSADQMRGTGRFLDLSDYVFMLNRLDNGLTYFQFSKGRAYKGDRTLDDVLQVEKKEDNGMLGFTPVQWIKEADLIASVQVEKTPEQLQKEQQVILLGEEMHEHHMEGKTYREIAKIYKYSHTHVGRLIDKYLATIPLDVLKERGKYSEPQSSESFEL